MTARAVRHHQLTQAPSFLHFLCLLAPRLGIGDLGRNVQPSAHHRKVARIAIAKKLGRLKPQVEQKSLPHKNQICGSSVSVPKLKINVLLLKIEILEKNPERSPKNGGLYFSEEQDPVLTGEEETM